MLEDVKVCMPRATNKIFFGDDFSYTRLPRSKLKQELAYLQDNEVSIGQHLAAYSMIYHLVSEVLHRFFSNSSEISTCLRSFYGGYFGITDENYSEHFYTEPHRSAITQWIQHGQKHNYRLVFSLIPSKQWWIDNARGTGAFDSALKEFITEQGGEFTAFSEYIIHEGQGRQAIDLYYQNDGHFNAQGHQSYARYLHSILYP
jgi:hypothetical protein